MRNLKENEDKYLTVLVVLEDSFASHCYCLSATTPTLRVYFQFANKMVSRITRSISQKRTI